MVFEVSIYKFQVHSALPCWVQWRSWCWVRYFVGWALQACDQENVKWCFMLEFDYYAFIIDSTTTEKDLIYHMGLHLLQIEIGFNPRRLLSEINLWLHMWNILAKIYIICQMRMKYIDSRFEGRKLGRSENFRQMISMIRFDVKI